MCGWSWGKGDERQQSQWGILGIRLRRPDSGCTSNFLVECNSFYTIEGQSDHAMLGSCTNNNQSGWCNYKEMWQGGVWQDHLRRLPGRIGTQSLPWPMIHFETSLRVPSRSTLCAVNQDLWRSRRSHWHLTHCSLWASIRLISTLPTLGCLDIQWSVVSTLK